MTPNSLYFSLKQIKAHRSTNKQFPTIRSHQIKSIPHIQNEAIAIHVHPCPPIKIKSPNYKRSPPTVEVASYAVEVASYAFKQFSKLEDNITKQWPIYSS